MKDNILFDSYKDILNDTSLTRLATLTTIIYSIIFVIYVVYQTYSTISETTDQSKTIDIAIEYISFFIKNIEFAGFIFIWAIILAIWYFLLPPIADWALISYVKNKKHGWKKALSKWILNFFPMFEYNAMTSAVNFLVFFIAISRAYSMWILNNIFIQILIWIWWLVLLFASIFFHYSKFFIILKWLWPIDAMKESIFLTFENFFLTIKFVFISYLLYIRFILNILFVIFIPLFLIRLNVKLWFFDSNITKFMIYTSFWLLIILTAYINWIIEAFFISYWYKVFEKTQENTED